MKSICLAALLLASAMGASAAPIREKQVAFVGAGGLVHEGLLNAEPADVALAATLRRAYIEPPAQLWVGPGILTVHTPTRHFDLTVSLRAETYGAAVGARAGGSMTVTIQGPDGSGALALVGADGFFRGPGAHQFAIVAGPEHGRYDVAYGGLAEIAE